jgi:hypothetical protein
MMVCEIDSVRFWFMDPQVSGTVTLPQQHLAMRGSPVRIGAVRHRPLTPGPAPRRGRSQFTPIGHGGESSAVGLELRDAVVGAQLTSWR